MKSLVLVAALVLGSAAHAGSAKDTPAIAKIRAAQTACLNSDDAVSTMGMNACNNEAFEAADKELNKVYKKLVKGLEASDKEEKKFKETYNKTSKRILERLQDAQRAWVKFRDAECMYIGTEMLDGTGEGVIIGGCLVGMTMDRVNVLSQTSEQ